MATESFYACCEIESTCNEGAPKGLRADARIKRVPLDFESQMRETS
jgi:hypothetical protein